MARFIYRCHNGEHLVIDTHDGSVRAAYEASRRYPAHRGAAKNYAKRLNEEEET